MGIYLFVNKRQPFYAIAVSLNTVVRTSPLSLLLMKEKRIKVEITFVIANKMSSLVVIMSLDS